MNKQIKLMLCMVLLVPTLVFALTLNEYIDTLDNSYYDGTINITVFNNNMIDTNSNSENDTLTFNLTTDYATSDLFTANVFFDDETIPVLSDTKVISSTNQSFSMNISTFYLEDSMFTYFVRIYNEIGQIVYESNKQNTSSYSNYETGTDVTQITDENVNNDLIRINLTLNVTRNETANITVNLGYNNKTISVTKESTLTGPSQAVSIDFDNETIKSTHYSGTYNITSIIIGDKVLNQAQLTSSYNYETFAKTSYISNTISGELDNNSNNLSEALQFNFTCNIKSNDDYTIEAALYNAEDNLIKTIAKNITLTTGTQKVVTEVLGKDIYSSYYSGELKLSFAKLSVGNVTKDTMYDAHTTNITYYSDFERPDLPDLTVDVKTTFLSGTTTVNVNVTNEGDVPAFNIFMDIFDNNTYENQSQASFLDTDDSVVFNFSVPDTVSTSIFTAIVDFDNYVDENNESNNIDDNFESVSSLNISNFQVIYADDTFKVFEFIIENNGSVVLEDISWNLDTDNGNVIYSNQNITLSPNEEIRIIAGYNYTSYGLFTPKSNAIAENANATESLQFTISNETTIIEVSDLQVLDSNNTKQIFGFNITNRDNNSRVVDWTLDTGDQTISSTIPITLSVNETVFVHVYYEYSTTGDYEITATASNGTDDDSDTINIDVPDIEAYNLSLLDTTPTVGIFEFWIENTLPLSLLAVNWTFDTADSNVITADSLTTLESDERMFVFVEYNFSSSGSYNINATAINMSLKDSINKTIII